ncbi:MAG: PaaI family thioesterase [Hyphomonadaceae bacterium]|jgi:uncharacterized protein (TIGR00369 family)|nr:PaaI family thioesterase [Hyphomonadaceae bacterium]
MPLPAGTDAFLELAFAAQLPLAWMGAELTETGDGTVTITVPFRDDLTTAGTGVVMGGIIATIADVAAGLSVITRLDPPRPITTLDFTSHQITAARGGQIVAVGQVEKVGRSFAVAGADVFVVKDGERQKCARLTATFAVA